MHDDLKKGIIKTLTYYDVFDYPLTLSEIKKFSQSKIDLSDSALLDLILSIPIIQESGGYYYFLGRSEIVAKRQEKYEIGFQKFVSVKIMSNIISKIPTIEYMGVIGGTTLEYDSPNDNIGLFIISSPNSLWLTRALTNLLLTVLNGRKGKEGRIYLHSIIDKKNLLFTKKYRNLYYANLLVKLRSFYIHNEADVELLSANKWIVNFLPNIKSVSLKRKKKKKTLLNYLMINVNLVVFVISCKIFDRKSKDQKISNHTLFGRTEKGKSILEFYELRLKKYLKLYEEDIWIESEEARFYLDEKKVRILN